MNEIKAKLTKAQEFVDWVRELEIAIEDKGKLIKDPPKRFPVRITLITDKNNVSWIYDYWIQG